MNYSRRSPQGNRQIRRILNQAANSAVKYKGSIFEILYRRYVPRLGHKHTIGIIAHKLCRLIWKILHLGVRYEERGPEVSKTSKLRRTQKMIRELRRLGYRIELTTPHQRYQPNGGGFSTLAFRLVAKIPGSEKPCRL